MTARHRRTAALGLSVLAVALLAAGVTAQAAPPPTGIPATLNVAGSATPGHVKAGDTVRITVKVSGSVKFQVGIPVGDYPANPSQHLAPPVNGFYVWTPGKLGKNKTKTLSFDVTIVPPQGATGTGLWCVTITEAPGFAPKALPLWTKSEQVCYVVMANSQRGGPTS